VPRKKKTTPADATPWTTRLAEWLRLTDPDVRKRCLRAFAVVAVMGLIVYALNRGLDKVETFVHAMPRYDAPVRLQWDGLPDWLRLPENRHILEDLTRRTGLTEADRPLDDVLAERVGKALDRPDIGWVKSVERVTVRPDGVVAVRCQFRRPIAWVPWGRYCYLVDAERVRLPGRYDPAACQTGVLLPVVGVRSGPPEVGQIWPGDDLASGLAMAGLLGDQAFRHQITGVLVSNHDGRQNKSRPHIELATDRVGSRIWWGRPPGEEHGTEIAARQKLTLLEMLYREWGRVDMNRAYVDIMTWPDRVAMPAEPSPARPHRLLRG